MIQLNELKSSVAKAKIRNQVNRKKIIDTPPMFNISICNQIAEIISKSSCQCNIPPLNLVHSHLMITIVQPTTLTTLLTFQRSNPRFAYCVVINIERGVSSMKNPGCDIAEHHTLEAVYKSQPLKHNGERALTPAVHCQIRPAVTVHSGLHACFITIASSW